MAAMAFVESSACVAFSEESRPEKERAVLYKASTGLSDASTAAGDTASEAPRQVSGSPRSPCSVVGNVASLSRCPEGCRRVQEALDKAASDSERELIVSELHGHVIKAMRCPHANHVLQKCISVMPPASLQFIVDELLEQEGLVKKMATHRYGGRIVQQLLKRCTASQVAGLAEAVLQDAVALSCHTFGNYVVNHLLEFGTPEQKYSLVRTLEQNMDTIARTSPGDGVIAAAMSHAAVEDRVWIARAAMQDPSLISQLAHGRHGHLAVLQMLDALPRQQHVRACESLAAGMAELKASRYGRKVAVYLQAAARK